jgi:hypothetical protein
LRRASLLIVALTGCMKIYPDPELPDIEVGWVDQDCRDNTRDVRVTVTGLDTDSTTTTTVPCADQVVYFRDVARERFHVDGALLDLAGNVFITSDGGDVDLRNGFNQDTGLFFQAFSNFRVTWTFDGGSSCASLAAYGVAIVFSLPGMPDIDGYQVPCEFPELTGMVAADTYTAHLQAYAGDQTIVAVSPETAPFVIAEDGFTDLGTLTLTPCGAACP